MRRIIIIALAGLLPAGPAAADTPTALHIRLLRNHYSSLLWEREMKAERQRRHLADIVSRATARCTLDHAPNQYMACLSLSGVDMEDLK